MPEKPSGIEQSRILETKIWNRIHKFNQNYMAAICGETGSGKSWYALKIAEMVDPEFSIEQVAFSPLEFVQLVKNPEYGKGSFIVLDEAGVAASSRDWYTESNKLLNFILQTWRYQNRGALFTLPSLELLDSQSRGLLQAFIEILKNGSRNEGFTVGKYMNIQKDPRSGKVYYKYPRLRDPTDKTVYTGKSKRKQFKILELGKPSEQLREDYEEKSQEVKERLEDRVVDALEEEQREKEDIPPLEIAERIMENDELEDYVEEHPGGQYIDRDMLSMELKISDNKAKKVKKRLKKLTERDLD